MVHPLREEPAVQWHLVGADGLEPLHQGLGECGTGEVGDQAAQVFGRGVGAADLLLQCRQEFLTRAPAAHGVEAGGAQAVVETTDIVCQNHMRPLWIRFIQGTQVAQVVWAFREPPVVVLGLVVKVRQRDAPGLATTALHAQQRQLHLAALLVVEVWIPVSKVLDDLCECREVPRAWAGLLEEALQPPVHLKEAVILSLKAQEPALVLFRIGHGNVASDQEHQGVHVQHLMRVAGL
mmetsp:Transcript_44725/g.83532  ORF Transcript_44725/g.83532 Transcript_44725/m.83532 type:complete len:236 (+) Transcript_44725:574-1281(+)